MPKLKLHLTNNIIEELSKANRCAVERLLCELKDKIESDLNEEIKKSPDSLGSNLEFSGTFMLEFVTFGCSSVVTVGTKKKNYKWMHKCQIYTNVNA